MTVQLDWPPEVVVRLREEARELGLSLDAYLLQTVLEHRARSGPFASPEAGAQSSDGDQRIEELFEAFDAVSVPAGLREEAFHRDN
jgi:hypothetical protein